MLQKKCQIRAFCRCQKRNLWIILFSPYTIPVMKGDEFIEKKIGASSLGRTMNRGSL
jgi:hypothetical protein